MLSGNYGLGAFLVRESFREASVCFRGRGQMLGNMIHVANHVAVMLGSCCVAVARVSWRNHVAIMLRVSLGLFFFGFPQFLLGFRKASGKLPESFCFSMKKHKIQKTIMLEAAQHDFMLLPWKLPRSLRLLPGCRQNKQKSSQKPLNGNALLNSLQGGFQTTSYLKSISH